MSRRWKERARAFPATFRLAVALWVVWGALHVFGLRDWVSVLSGTPVEGVPHAIAGVGGALYVLAWFGAVLLAPVLALGAAFGELGRALLRRRSAGASRGETR